MVAPLYWRYQKEKYGIIKDFIKGGFGKILSYSIIRVAPDGYESPYIIGIVDLEGSKIVGEICGGDIQNLQVKNLINKKVSVIFRKLKKESNGLRVYGYKFLLEN